MTHGNGRDSLLYLAHVKKKKQSLFLIELHSFGFISHLFVESVN